MISEAAPTSVGMTGERYEYIDGKQLPGEDESL